MPEGRWYIMVDGIRYEGEILGLIKAKERNDYGLS
jgi:hypothetical protein